MEKQSISASAEAVVISVPDSPFKALSLYKDEVPGHTSPAPKKSETGRNFNAERKSVSEKWKRASNMVKMGVALSKSFKTLRDQTGVNEIQPEELKTVTKLGEGGFAVVEKCKYTPKDGGPVQTVAVKKLKPELMSSDEDMKSFMDEISLMRKLKHDNIVQYIGIGHSGDDSTGDKGPVFLVSELMEGGTLKKLVQKQLTLVHKVVYTYGDALRWCINIADALAYMHGSIPVVIHRDLKLENVLLSGAERSQQVAKLADFGLVTYIAQKQQKQHELFRSQSLAASSSNAAIDSSDPLVSSDSKRAITPSLAQANEQTWNKKSKQLLTRMSSKNFSGMMYNTAASATPADKMMKKLLTGQTGTYMYMAPEMFDSKQYDEKVDVFSFGIIMYELFHKYMMICVVSIKGTPEEIEAYAAKVARGYRPPLNKKLPEVVQKLITDAWAQDPKKRPSMTELLGRLRDIQESGVMASMDTGGGCCTIS